MNGLAIENNAMNGLAIENNAINSLAIEHGILQCKSSTGQMSCKSDTIEGFGTKFLGIKSNAMNGETIEHDILQYKSNTEQVSCKSHEMHGLGTQHGILQKINGTGQISYISDEKDGFGTGHDILQKDGNTGKVEDKRDEMDIGSIEHDDIKVESYSGQVDSKGDEIVRSYKNQEEKGFRVGILKVEGNVSWERNNYSGLERSLKREQAVEDQRERNVDSCLENNVKKELTVEDQSFNLEKSASGQEEEMVKENCYKMEFNGCEVWHRNVCGPSDENGRKGLQDSLIIEGHSVPLASTFSSTVTATAAPVAINPCEQKTNKTDDHKSEARGAKTQSCVETDVPIKQEPFDELSSAKRESNCVNSAVVGWTPVTIKCEPN